MRSLGHRTIISGPVKIFDHRAKVSCHYTNILNILAFFFLSEKIYSFSSYLVDLEFILISVIKSSFPVYLLYHRLECTKNQC